MDYHYQLAIGAIFRNEARYLKEWIEFHRTVGCEHFYLFNNLSTDSYLEVLQPYIDSGIVELFSWPIEHDTYSDWGELQCLAYERAVFLAKGKTKWLAILDTDEFLFPTKKDHLVDCLNAYENFGGIGVNWQVFGTSNVDQIPNDKLLIETLHLKLPINAKENRQIKSIIRPEAVKECKSSHTMIYHPGYFQINSDFIPFIGKDSPYVQIDTLRINHYQVRDESYLRSEKIPRVRKWWNAKSPEDWAGYYASFNAVHDETIFRFIPHLRQ